MQNQTVLGVAPPVPKDINRTIKIGLLIILCTIGAFLAWACLTPLASAVLASGVVKVDGSSKKIQHQQGGTVRQIRVKDGDHVSAGDILIDLDDTSAGASLAMLEAGYFSGLAQRDRLMAERDELTGVDFVDLLTLRDKDETVQKILRTQLTLFAARRESLTAQVEIIEQQITHFNDNVEGIKAQKKAKEKQIRSLSSELKDLRGLLSDGVVDRTRVLALERQMAELEGDLGAHISDIAAALTSIGEKRLQIFQLRNGFREEVVSEIKQVQSEIFDIAERINASKHTLKETKIRAPVEGTIVGVGVTTIGGVIGPGEVLLEIVPSNGRMIIEAIIQPQDIDEVQVGLSAGVKFTAFNQRTTPELYGLITYVSANSHQNEKTGEEFFVSRIEVSDKELFRLTDKIIHPGLQADILIRTGERTPADYLLQPIYESFRKSWREG